MGPVWEGEGDNFNVFEENNNVQNIITCYYFFKDIFDNIYFFDIAMLTFE